MTSSSTVEKSNRLPVIACGILKKEILYLAKENNWDINAKFLDSSLHCHFSKLETALKHMLARVEGKGGIVVYGCCHPQMDDFISLSSTTRTPAQNCVEMLLGRERFSSELSKGTFFLFEDWARRWEEVSLLSFGDWEIMREVFAESHSSILAIETPCSGDFATDAEVMSSRVGLPLRWETFSLEKLEELLVSVINKPSERV